MASVTLEQAWFHDAEDLSTYVAADLNAASEQAERVGEVRRYANGRLRLITGPARPGVLDVQLEYCSRVVVDQLRAWIGKRLFYRDPRGRTEFGTFMQLSVDEIPGVGDDVANVSLGFQKLTGTVAV